VAGDITCPVHIDLVQ
jgi:hypothetical protein